MPEDQRYELLVQSVIDFAIYMINPDGVVSSWNTGAARIKGYTAEEIIGQHFSLFYTPEDRADGRPARALQTARDTGRFEDETWRVRKNGERFWALVVIDAIRSEDGELLGFAKITRDMTERRAAQQALLESERRFRLLVEGVTDYAIYMLDPTGRVTNWNAGAMRAKGYTAEEIIGESFSRFYTEEDRAAGVPERALATAERVGRFEAEGWRVRKDGARFRAHVVIDAIRDDRGVLIGFAKVTRDVTERMLSEQRLVEAREQLFQAQKLEALGQLTGGMAHDFNNLLTAILGAADLATRQKDPSKVAALLDNIRASAQRGNQLTRQLLAFARGQTLSPVTVDVTDLLPSTAGLLRHSLSHQIELITEFSDRSWKIEADPGQLELAILNLGFNARDAMPEGGTLRLSARNVSLEGTPDGLQGDFVAIAVADTGSGIPAQIMDRVLEPFFTTKAFGQGTGLGLSQVFGFAKQSGGTLTLESTEGQGTIVTLYLPVSRPARELAGAGQAARVLVVEDDEVVAELAAQILEEMGYEPQVVHGASDALAHMERNGPPDLMFSDVVMPGGLSGLELARRVRVRFPELPILLTSGYSERLGHQDGEFAVVPKPYQFEVLEAALSSLLTTGDA